MLLKFPENLFDHFHSCRGVFSLCRSIDHDSFKVAHVVASFFPVRGRFLITLKTFDEGSFAHSCNYIMSISDEALFFKFCCYWSVLENCFRLAVAR